MGDQHLVPEVLGLALVSLDPTAFADTPYLLPDFGDLLYVFFRQMNTAYKT